MTNTNTVSLVPDRNNLYVPFGHFSDVEKIIQSKIFYPTYITGLSGNGKTVMVEQACAKEGREMIRVNCTAETDEDDLLGGFRLVNGDTVWHDGPVVMAMERGAILLLDEVDLGTVKLMCLQPILEGKAIYLKKINRVVRPAPGFNIIATANTKGQGSDSGKFVGTNIMNEAFLERFSITFEQDFPSINTEENILGKLFKSSGYDKDTDKNFIKLLVKWASVIRKTYNEDGLPEVISTRRLTHICNSYMIFGRDRNKALQLCLNRFDKVVQEAFKSLYVQMDGGEPTSTSDTSVHVDPDNVEVPF